MNRYALFCCLFLSLAFQTVYAQNSPIGTWKTIDDGTGEAKSHVEIFEKDGKLHGKIVKILTDRPNAKCTKCKGDKKDQPINGLQIIEDMEAYKDYWRDGRILDPESGKDYGCSIWFEEGNTKELKVRGKHWTGLYRTQTWYLVE